MLTEEDFANFHDDSLAKANKDRRPRRRHDEGDGEEGEGQDTPQRRASHGFGLSDLQVSQVLHLSPKSYGSPWMRPHS